MATRPIFIPSGSRLTEDGERPRGPLVERVDIEIQWHGGFSIAQKQKNIAALHAQAAALKIHPVLEISTKSLQEVGRRLSAFNLKVDVGGHMKTLESVYQACKVFSVSGQHWELSDLPPGEAKRRAREVGKGEIIGFRFLNEDFETTPRNAFYDWLYLRAILPHEQWIRRNLDFAAYSDIEFNPQKSINCQARAVAEFHALSLRGQALSFAHNFESFRKLLILAQREDDV